MWIDNVIVRALTRLFDLILLNVLWLLCSLPVVTLGAATAAMYSVTLKMAGKEEGYIAKDFFMAFKQNLKKGVIIWLGLLTAGIVIGLDFVVLQKIPGVIGNILTVFLGIAAAVYIIELIFVFPILARFENTIRDTIINGFLIPVSRLPYAAAVLLMTVMCVILTLLNQFTVMAGAVIFSSVGTALLAFANSFLLREMFRQYER
ncbi:MAG: DUF624 domain-containing protein [Dorea sp.]|jgi:uncharacterized membrane protein YesL|nr:DUF624 domain-containing protein [Dorea sp.]